MQFPENSTDPVAWHPMSWASRGWAGAGGLEDMVRGSCPGNQPAPPKLRVQLERPGVLPGGETDGENTPQVPRGCRLGTPGL